MRLSERLKYFQNNPTLSRGNWWFALCDYLPNIFGNLTDDEFAIFMAFLDEAARVPYQGECQVPIMSEMLGFINGSGPRRVVQAGHYAGWSTLLIGWELRRIGIPFHGLFSIDINAAVSAFARGWVTRAGLSDIVELAVGDSSDPEMVERAEQYLGGPPQMMFIDSSHQYAHTLKELDLWYPRIQPGGLIFMHDVSLQAAAYDKTKEGGVHRALTEWRAANPNVQAISINRNHPTATTTPNVHTPLVRLDGCGVGIIQKDL